MIATYVTQMLIFLLNQPMSTTRLMCLSYENPDQVKRTTAECIQHSIAVNDTLVMTDGSYFEKSENSAAYHTLDIPYL